MSIILLILLISMFYWNSFGYKYERINGVGEFWMKGHRYHRKNGPAKLFKDGDSEWWVDGKLHREDGPAIDNVSRKVWYINGLIHREDGPAIEWVDGGKEWWLLGIRITENEFRSYSRKRKINMLIS